MWLKLLLPRVLSIYFYQLVYLTALIGLCYEDIVYNGLLFYLDECEVILSLPVPKTTEERLDCRLFSYLDEIMCFAFTFKSNSVPSSLLVATVNGIVLTAPL